MTTYNLMVGGPAAALPANWQALPGQWVGVDRGTLRLLTAAMAPVFAVGDFDSLTREEFAQVKAQVKSLHQAPAEKDETDTEMAVRFAFAAGADQVRLVGATGGRLDHLLSNLFLPTQPRFQAFAEQIELVDAQNQMRFFRPGRHTLQPQSAYPYLGIVPLTAISLLTIQGAKYPLQDWSSQTPFSWASNEFVGPTPVTIQWQSGMVAVIYSRDRLGQKQNN
ncbi:thiamine diphosphokinase [Lacticaseibacillus suibinensis]|uniref:thiamine diphosphokinase n=1 Tax=Lacticaseibacillus suibinensis TaxID=2486011 RepID=UPI000F7802C4|nr:thiamine diphosphokinase [Lacticaseibacillus suibinensis]